MKISNRISITVVAALLMLTSTGCATYTTISAAELGSAKVFSGTRLDARAISGELTPTKKFKVSPPPYPVMDLPFSFILDIVMLPLTLSAALYEYLFE